MTVDSSKVALALVGIGGYGNSYLTSILDRPVHLAPRIVGVADPSPQGCSHLHELVRRRIPIYESLEELQQNHNCDLMVASSPLHLHCQHTISALSHGSHVLCEKPLAGSPAQAKEMIQARNRSKKQVSIGYQWSFSEAIQALKRDISSGLLGKPKRLRTLVLWPRSEAYYTRNSWAGRRLSQEGMPIFDSPLNNACAHHLHNMMYVLGAAVDRSAATRSVTAELYRVNDIETFDTAVVRAWTCAEVEVLCAVSHATRRSCGPAFTFEFESATVVFEGTQPNMDTRDGDSIRAYFNDGRLKEYGSPEKSPDRKLWAAVESAVHNTPTVCGIEASLAQCLLTAAIHQSVPEAHEFPGELWRIEQEAHDRRWVEGLDFTLQRCYATGKLPSELDVPWAAPGKEIHFVNGSVMHDGKSIPRRAEVQVFSTARREVVL